MSRRAFITGCGGQDGSFLAEFLLAEGYHVSGLVRPSGEDRTTNLAKILHHKNFGLVYGDITSPSFAHDYLLGGWDEVYLLAAQTHVMQSYHAPQVAFETNALSVSRALDTLWRHSPKTRVYFAATSEMFGTMPPGVKANEDYPLAAQSPYAAAKVASHLLCRTFRERGMYVTSGVSFNHESCRRGANFVTRKVGLGVRNFLKTDHPVVLGNIEAIRDWYHASDTVRGMWLSLQPEAPDEYVFASGTPRSVLDLAVAVCRYFGVDVDDAIGVQDSEKRPWDVNYLCGDASKAYKTLGWLPAVTWDQLIEDVCKP